MIGQPAREHVVATLAGWRERRPVAIPRKRAKGYGAAYAFAWRLEEAVERLSDRAVPAVLSCAADKARTAQDIAVCLDYLTLLAEACGVLPIGKDE